MTPRSDHPSGSSREDRDRKLFDTIAGQYAAKDDHRGCQFARRHRLEATVDLIQLDTSSSVLEVGCGAGFSAEYLSGRYRSFVGIDYSESLIREARRRHSCSGASFLVADGKDFGATRAFDVIVMIGVLHHIPDKDGLLRNLVRALSPGGWLVANEPQPGNPLVRVARRLRSWVDQSYSREQEQLSRKEMIELFQRHGLGSIRSRWQGYLSTPLAEVPLRPERLFTAVSRGAVWADRHLEPALPDLLGRWSWNCTVAGRKGEDTMLHESGE